MRNIIGKPNASMLRAMLFLLIVLMAGEWPGSTSGAQMRTTGTRTPGTESGTPGPSGSDIPDFVPAVVLDYSNVPDGAKAVALTDELLHLGVANTTDAPLLVQLEATSISGGDDWTSLIETVSLRPFEKVAVPISTKFMRATKSQSFASQFLVTGRILDSRKQFNGRTTAPEIFYHRDERGVMFAYRTLINRGIVGPLNRSLTKEVLEAIAKADSVGIGKAGPAPRDPFLGTPMKPQLRRFDPPEGLFGFSTQVCVTLRVYYEDNGRGEDYWPTNERQPAFGVSANVRDGNGNIVFDDTFAADGFDNNDVPGGDTVGCLPWVFTTYPYNWTLTVRSSARVRNNNIEVFTSNEAENQYTWVMLIDQLNPGQNFIPITHVTRQSSVLAASSWAIFRHNGGLLTGDYKIHTGASASHYDSGVGKIRLTNSGSWRKFTIAHELGHALLFERLGADRFGVDDISHNADEPCSSPAEASGAGTHNMASKEFNSAALHEGFAHFYAVDTWNNHQQQDGLYVSHNVVYDADPPLGTPGFPWMRFHCRSPYIGFGNPTDWMRFFWDFHTGGVSPVDPVPFNDIVEIIAHATGTNSNPRPIPATNAYGVLAEAVQTFNQGMWSYEFFYWADQNLIFS